MSVCLSVCLSVCEQLCLSVSMCSLRSFCLYNIWSLSICQNEMNATRELLCVLSLYHPLFFPSFTYPFNLLPSTLSQHFLFFRSQLFSFSVHDLAIQYCSGPSLILLNIACVSTFLQPCTCCWCALFECVLVHGSHLARFIISVFTADTEYLTS